MTDFDDSVALEDLGRVIEGQDQSTIDNLVRALRLFLRGPWAVDPNARKGTKQSHRGKNAKRGDPAKGDLALGELGLAGGPGHLGVTIGRGGLAVVRRFKIRRPGPFLRGRWTRAVWHKRRRLGFCPSARTKADQPQENDVQSESGRSTKIVSELTILYSKR